MPFGWDGFVGSKISASPLALMPVFNAFRLGWVRRRIAPDGIRPVVERVFNAFRLGWVRRRDEVIARDKRLAAVFNAFRLGWVRRPKAEKAKAEKAKGLQCLSAGMGS